MASGIGAELERPPLAAHAFWFGEDQGRYVVTVSAARAERIIQRGRAAAFRCGGSGSRAVTH